MSQKFSVPQINIDPKKFDVTSSPAFKQQMENLRAAGASATAAIANGKNIAAAVTERVNNMPAFELDPQVKEQLAPVRSPAAQAAMDRISAGFAHIEAVRKATQLPALKVNA